MSTNWLGQYGPRKYQAGGAMPPPEEAGAPAGPEAAPAGGGGDLQAMLMEYAESRDPQLAVAICDALVEMMAAQGGGAPAGGPPMARKGAKLTSRGPVFKK